MIFITFLNASGNKQNHVLMCIWESDRTCRDRKHIQIHTDSLHRGVMLVTGLF